MSNEPKLWLKNRKHTQWFPFLAANAKTASILLTRQRAQGFHGIRLAERKRRGKGKEDRASSGSQEWNGLKINIKKITQTNTQKAVNGSLDAPSHFQ